MNDFLVQQENLLHCSSFDRVAETKIEISQAPTTGNFSGKWKRYYLHIGAKKLTGGPYCGRGASGGVATDGDGGRRVAIRRTIGVGVAVLFPALTVSGSFAMKLLIAAL